jgi:hypothetical protein
MTTQKITATLTRWHKLAERIKNAAQEQRQDVLSTLQAGGSLDMATFTVRGDALLSRAKDALTGGAETVLRLQEALFLVRKELASANVRFKVSDLLAEMELAKQEQQFWDACIETAKNRISAQEMKQLGDLRAAQTATQTAMSAHDRFSLSLVSDEAMVDMKAKRDAARRKVNALSDKIANANAAQLSLDIDQSVVNLVGLTAD